MVDWKENAIMKIPKFKNEAEEADWLYAHRREIEAALRKEKPKKTPTVQEVIDREQTKAISIRLSVGDLEIAKQRAKEEGIGYQTLIRMLLHASLQNGNALLKRTK
jgi:predicted DNA binding CopG/RHH family protein